MKVTKPRGEKCDCHCHLGSKKFNTRWTIKPKHLKSDYCEACKREENCIHCNPPLPNQEPVERWEDEIKERWLKSSGITSIDFIIQELSHQKALSRAEGFKEGFMVGRQQPKPSKKFIEEWNDAHIDDDEVSL